MNLQINPADANERPAGSDPQIAPVRLARESPDAVTHSLAILATVYNYNHWIYNSIRGSLGNEILEVGSGIGNISQFLLNANRLVCLEPYAEYRQYLAERFTEHRNVVVLPHRIQDCPNGDVLPGQFDSVICMNVLEHIEDDVEALRRIRELLRRGGRAILFVPALPCIYGAMDKGMGHFRRYTRKSLDRALRSAGLHPVSSRYMNLPGVFGWWWRGVAMGKPLLPEKQARMFDRMVPMISALEQLVPPPFGQSLLMVASAG